MEMVFHALQVYVDLLQAGYRVGASDDNTRSTNNQCHVTNDLVKYTHQSLKTVLGTQTRANTNPLAFVRVFFLRRVRRTNIFGNRGEVPRVDHAICNMYLGHCRRNVWLESRSQNLRPR